MNSELGGNEEIHDTFLVYELLTWKPWKIFVTLLNLCSNLGKKLQGHIEKLLIGEAAPDLTA